MVCGLPGQWRGQELGGNGEGTRRKWGGGGGGGDKERRVQEPPGVEGVGISDPPPPPTCPLLWPIHKQNYNDIQTNEFIKLNATFHCHLQQ